MQFCTYGCMLLISWFGARAVVACGGDAALGLSTGELTSLFTYTMQILSSLTMSSFMLLHISRAKVSVDRVNEVLDTVAEMTGRKKLPTLPLWVAYVGLPFLWLWSRLTGKRPLYTAASLASLQADTDFPLDDAHVKTLLTTISGRGVKRSSRIIAVSVLVPSRPRVSYM